MEINFQHYVSDCRAILTRKESGIFIGLPTDATIAFMEDCKKAHYIVRQFNLNAPANSNHWNMLTEVQKNPERATEIANILCNTLTDWTIQPAAASLLESLMLYVAFDDDYKDMPEGQNIIGVYHVLLSLLAATSQGVNKYFESLCISGKQNGNPLRFKSYYAYRSYPKSVQKKAAGMLLSALNGILADSIQSILLENDIDLALPARVPCAYFIIPSLLHPMRNVLESLFLFSLFSNILDETEKSKDKRCAVPVSVLTKFYDLQTFGRFSRQKLDYMEGKNIQLKVF